MGRILFVDIDGVLAEYRWSGIGEERKKGHFLSLEANRALCAALQELKRAGTDIYIVSKIMSDAPYCLPEKEQWLRRELPEIGQEKYIFVDSNANKSEVVAATIGTDINSNAVLLDDYTKNLQEWERAGGTAVKALNEINGKGKIWQGERIDIRKDRPKEEMISSLKKLLA